ncbi:MAG: ABC transporter permease [Candidatus Bipolaricaulota bacterium]
MKLNRTEVVSKFVAGLLGLVGWLVLIPRVAFARIGASLLKLPALPASIPLDKWTVAAVDWLALNLGPFFDFIKLALNTINNALLVAIQWVPIFVVEIGGLHIRFPVWSLLLFFLLWYLAGQFTTGLLGLVTMWLAANFGLYVETTETFALTLTSALIAISLGIPSGILAGISDTVHNIIRPILDLMQTMPVFVYLIPAVIFFGMGAAPGAVATVIFAYPPSVRLTNLGIREVPQELVEAGEAFGCNYWQLLMKVQIPVARPSIMQGVNQSIMLALSMAVIAALIGAGGLGGEVVRGIQRMRVGQGFVAGLAVVFTAMILDRATANIGARD